MPLCTHLSECRHAVPYVKLDCDMPQSSVWPDRSARSTFVTALLLAHPYELLAPTPQLAVRELAETGFVIPPGWYGLVPSAGPGLIRADANPEMEDGIAALERLCAPDPDSRSRLFEGRRMARIDGGYLILNYIKYRDKDHTAVTRQRRYRERLKHAANPHGDASRDGVSDVSNASRVTQAEAEAYAEAEAVVQEQPPLTPPHAGGSESASPTTTPHPRKSRNGAHPKVERPNAAKIVAAIRALRIQNTTGNGRAWILPRISVERMGAEILAAYQAVGGAERFITTDDAKLSFLIRDLQRALRS